MTVYGFLRGCMRLVIAVVLVLAGVATWHIVDATLFAQNASRVPGTFQGYHIVKSVSRSRDSRGYTSTRTSTTAFPMFTYMDREGLAHDVTGEHPHAFSHLEAGAPVTVLLAPSGAGGKPRLADFLSLYSEGIAGLFGSLLFALAALGGMRLTRRYLDPSAPAPAGASGMAGALQKVGAASMPSGVLGLLGGFFLLAFAMGGAVLYLDHRRKDPALAQALVDGDMAGARQMAEDGWGIDGMARGEPALVLAIKAEQSETAQALLRANAHAKVKAADGTLASHLAAAHGDHATLLLLLEHGGHVYDVSPQVVVERIGAGDVETLKVLFANGVNPHEKVNGRTLAQHAQNLGQPEVLALIRQHTDQAH